MQNDESVMHGKSGPGGTNSPDWAQAFDAPGGRSGGDAEPNPFPGIDMERMAKFASMMQQMRAASGEVSREGYEPVNGVDADGKTVVLQYDDAYYDACVQTPMLRAMKAAVPHMDAQSKRAMGLAVKWEEMKRLNAFYASTNVSSQTYARKDTWKLDMVRAMKPHMADETQKKKLAAAELLLRAQAMMADDKAGEGEFI